MSRFHLWSTIVTLSVLTCAAKACVIDLYENSYHADTWCVAAVGANGNDGENENHLILTSNFKTVRGCFNMCAWEHDIMVEGEINESIDPMDPLYDHWQFLRAQVYESGKNTCEARVAQIEAQVGPLTYNDGNNLNCEDAVNAVDVFLLPSKVPIPKSHCQGGGATFTGGGGDTGGTGGDGDGDGDDGDPPEGPEIYGLENYSDAIDCVALDSRTTMCTVDPAFVDDIIGGDWVLLWQDDQFVEVHSASPAGLEFTTCGSDSLAYYLGFREGDIVTRVDGFDVLSYSDVLDLWGYIVASEHFLVSARYRKASTGLDNTLHVKSCGFPGEACEDSSDCCMGLVCNVNDECAVPL